MLARQQTPGKFIALHSQTHDSNTFQPLLTSIQDFRDISVHFFFFFFLTAVHVKDLPGAFIKLQFSTEKTFYFPFLKVGSAFKRQPQYGKKNRTCQTYVYFQSALLSRLAEPMKLKKGATPIDHLFFSSIFYFFLAVPFNKSNKQMYASFSKSNFFIQRQKIPYNLSA